MAKTVAVDDSLTPIKKRLESRGYKVTQMGDSKIDAIVVNGIDENLMGMEDVIYSVPIINAKGKSPEDVITELEKKF